MQSIFLKISLNHLCLFIDIISHSSIGQKFKTLVLMLLILAWYKCYLFDNMLDTSGVQNIWFNLLWCSSQGEFVALRGKTLQAPQQVAPTSLLQQIQIKWLHTEGKQSIVGAHELSYFIFYSKFYFISGNEICRLLLSAPGRCLLHSMQFWESLFTQWECVVWLLFSKIRWSEVESSPWIVDLGTTD